MRIMHLALGGCLGGSEVRYGLTEDTGGHIAYVLGAAAAQARRVDVAAVEIVTRAFDDPRHDPVHADPETLLMPKCRILRLRGATPDYLEKDALAGELPVLTSAFLDLLKRVPRPDVIHAHFADAAELALAAREAFGIPLLYSPHSLALQKTPSGRGDDTRIARERRAITQADAIIASSQDEADRQIAAYDPDAAGRTWRIAPGVETDAAADGQRALRLIAPFLREPGKPLIVAIARPVDKKNLGALIDAFGGSKPLQRAANLAILAGQRKAIGAIEQETGRVTTDLFDRIDRQGLWGKVALPRTHTAADVQSLYALAARGGVFVNPALHEPFGLTVVEAAQHGVPVVATRHGGPAEIIDSIRYGKSVDPRDTVGIAEACLELMNDPKRADRAGIAQARAHRLYSWDRWAARVSRNARHLASPARFRRSVSRPRSLLVSDIDGTLTGDRHGAARLRAHLDATAEPGFAVATGRSITEARRVLADWDLPEPDCMITSVGSEIWLRTATGAYTRDRGFAETLLPGWSRSDVMETLDRAGARLQPAFTQRAFKVSAFGDAAEARRLAMLLLEAGHSVQVIASHERFIDVLPAAGGKGRAAGWLAASLGLGPDDCIAAGDSGNDRDLLTWAGRAIVPSNALAELDDLDGPGILRTRAAHASGILEGLDALLATGSPRCLAAE